MAAAGKVQDNRVASEVAKRTAVSKVEENRVAGREAKTTAASKVGDKRVASKVTGPSILGAEISTSAPFRFSTRNPPASNKLLLAGPAHTIT